MSTRRRNTIALGVLFVVAVMVGIVLATPAHADPFPPAVIGCTAKPSVGCPDDPAVTGIKFSTYTGRYFRAEDEGYRRCIAEREGRGQYWGTGSNGKYHGTYQLTRELARGAAWEMVPEIRATWPDRWRLIRNILLDTPARMWSRYWQDAAFWTILNVDGVREGAPHWAGGRWTCTPGMTWSP